jgi:hypothetical protein
MMKKHKEFFGLSKNCKLHTQKNRVMIQIIPCHKIDLTTLGSFKSTTF